MGDHKVLRTTFLLWGRASEVTAVVLMMGHYWFHELFVQIFGVGYAYRHKSTLHPLPSWWGFSLWGPTLGHNCLHRRDTASLWFRPNGMVASAHIICLWKSISLLILSSYLPPSIITHCPLADAYPIRQNNIWTGVLFYMHYLQGVYWTGAPRHFIAVS